ncbi:NAD(P)-dependent oxidoreductase [Planktomarina temperata]|nr:NAD(P)-dependent oxidoreductase [Planktomarina temperata]
MRILVTGASGFAAEHLIPKLKELNHYIIGLDRKPNASAKVDDYICLDLASDNLSEMLEISVDLVIHLAAARADWGISDEEFYRDNVVATENLIKAISRLEVKRFIFTSSISVMPQDSEYPLDEQCPNGPINAYGKSKETAENLLIQYTKTKQDFCLNILRPTVLYGPSDPENTGIYRSMDNNIFRLIDNIAKNRFAFVGNENTIKTAAYVDNFVDSIIFLMTPRTGYRIYIYCDMPYFETGKLVRTIRKLLGKKGIGPSIPYNVAKILALVFDKIGTRFKVNFPITTARINTFNRPTHFKRDALDAEGFVQNITNDEALQKTVSWYKETMKARRIRTFFLRAEIPQKNRKEN